MMKTYVAVLIVTLTHLSHAISLGFIYTNGIYQVVFLETFLRGATLTSWVSSVQLGLLSLAGPVASLLIGYLGCERTMFLGAGIASVGLAASAFTTGVEQLIFTFGFIAGTGFSFVFASSLCLIPEKFTKYRIVASGISLSGSGIGTVLWSWMSRYLLNQYGWRSALLISSGITLQVCVIGMLLRLICANVTAIPEREIENNIEEGKVKLQICDKMDNIKSTSFDRDKLYPRFKHRSLMNLKIEESYQCLAENKRTASCDLEKIQDDIRKRKQIADSFLGKSLSSIHELYRSAILYHEAEAEVEKDKFSQMVIITKEILRDLNFVLLSVNVLLFCFGLSVVFTHSAAYAASVGLNSSQINAILSSLGISNLLGRILLGVIGNQCKCLNIVFLYSGCYMLSGLGTVCMAWWPHPVGLTVCAAVIGFFTGAFAGVLTELTCLLLGAHRFYLSYGYMLVFMGIGFAIGAPIAGSAYDSLDYYPSALYIGGAAFLLSAIVIVPSYNSARQK